MGHGASCGRPSEEVDFFGAAQSGDLARLAAAVSSRPSLLRRTTLFDRLSALHIAAAHGHLQVVSMALDLCVQPDVVNRHKQTALMLAAMHGRTECVRRLLDAGANILMFDSSHGRTCLHYAAYYGHSDCLRAILSAAQTSPVSQSWGYARFVNVRDDTGATPLHLAARQGWRRCVHVLLENGAIVSASSGAFGFPGSTPLHLAARGGSLDCVRQLLSWGADRLQRDSVGRIPYEVAMKRGHVACAALLNPSSAEPLVWPSPLKFIRELEPDAKALLEAALMEANREREKRILKGTKSSVPSPSRSDDGSTISETMADLPPLLDGQYDSTHRCQQWINPEGPLGGPSTFRCRGPSNRWILDERFVPYLSRSGLLPFARMTSSPQLFKLDPCLLTSLVDRWRPETHTFHFRWGEMTPTLQDVSMITGLPLCGIPLVLPPARASWKEDFEQLMGQLIPRTRTDKLARGVPISWLVNFIGFPTGVSEEVVRRHLIAYLLYLFGMLFPSGNGEVVNPIFIRLAEHIALPLDNVEITQYSIGSAMLCQTYRGLCDASYRRKKVSSVAPILCVCYIFLQLWSWEHIPVGRPMIEDPVHPYSGHDVQFNCATMGTRWTYGVLRWARDLASKCYPLYHEDFETIHHSSITWNAWHDDYVKHVAGDRGLAIDCYRDQELWWTRCHLVCLYMVEPQNPERVMRQLDLYQEVPPPPPNCVESTFHEQSNQGKKNHNWLHTQRLWIDQWNSNKLTNIVPENRVFSDSTWDAYMTWYNASTRSKLTRTPTDRPAHRTRQEQLEGGIERTAANRRDDTLSRQHSIMANVREIVRENPRSMSNTIKSRLRSIFQNALHTATNWSCGRADDVMLRQYNMPESFSSRPSEARASLGNPARSASMRENTRTRQDSTLMRTSSRNTGEPSRPESSRQPPRIDFGSTHQPAPRGIFPEITRELFQETPTTPDDAWDDDDAGFNSNMPPPHPSIGHGSYYTYDQPYDQPQSSYNPGPSQPTYDPMMDFLYTDVGTSQIPDSQQDTETRDHFIPSPPNLRTNPRPTDPWSYPSDHIYGGRARKQPRQ